MTDFPIIFSAPMIRALLDGRKTMTRRLASEWRKFRDPVEKGKWLIGFRPTIWQRVKPGDRLWVRENFRNQQVSRYRGWSGDKPADYLLVCIDYVADGYREHFSLVDRIDHEAQGLPKILTKRGRGESGKDTVILPCIHMPREISRLVLVVTATKIERLQAISEADAAAEGWPKHPELSTDPEVHRDAARDWFSDLWEDLHGVESWKSNPGVVALTFTVYRINIDAMPQEQAA